MAIGVRGNVVRLCFREPALRVRQMNRKCLVRAVAKGLGLALLAALTACTTTTLPPVNPDYRPPVYRVPVEPVVSEPAVDRQPEISQPEQDKSSEDAYQAYADDTPFEVTEPVDPLEPEPFDDSPLYSAEVQLLEDAQRYSASGNLQLASASVERVLRINPHSAPALYELAKLRMAQSAPKEAEQLLLKAIAGSAYDRRSQDQRFQRQLWELVVKARTALRDIPGAQAAQARVDALR